MIEDSIINISDRIILEFLRSIFEQVKEREGSLSAMEAFAVEVIHDLHEPTIREFADFLNISQSNATYKVNSLIKKGYIEKQNSETDRREYHLILSDKYYRYTDQLRTWVEELVRKVEKEFPPEDLKKLETMINQIAEEMI